MLTGQQKILIVGTKHKIYNDWKTDKENVGSNIKSYVDWHISMLAQNIKFMLTGKQTKKMLAAT